MTWIVTPVKWERYPPITPNKKDGFSNQFIFSVKETGPVRFGIWAAGCQEALTHPVKFLGYLQQLFYSIHSGLEAVRFRHPQQYAQRSWFGSRAHPTAYVCVHIVVG